MIGSHLSKLFPADIPYITYLIVSWKAENAVQVTKTLYNIIKQPLLPSTIQFHLKKAGIRAVVKSKYPLLLLIIVKLIRLGLCLQGLDCKWLKKGYRVKP